MTWLSLFSSAVRWLIGRWCRQCDGDAARHGGFRVVAGVTLDGCGDGVGAGAGDGDGNGNEERDVLVVERPRRNPWPFVIEPGDLTDRDKLMTLWEWSLARGWRHRGDLLRFVTLGVSCERRAAEGAIRSAAGAFTSCCRQGLWFGTCEDEQKAEAIIGLGFEDSS